MATADDTPQGPVVVPQTVFVFPGEQFDPNCVRLVTRGRDPATAVACLLGFFKLVCEDGYEQVVRASGVDGNWLDEVHVGGVSGASVCRQLRALCANSEPAATMDDFYVLLGVLLRNLARMPGRHLHRDWFLKRVGELVKLFPGVSEPPPVPLYGQEQADAVSNFGQQWPHTRAALCRALLKSRFGGPMQQLQEYVSEGWRFAGLKHVQLILEFLSGRNSWVLDIIPEVRAKGDILQDFLKVFRGLGADGPYMNLLHLPETATANRKRLGLHVAAAYALAVSEDEKWLQYKGVPRDEAEEAVLAKITAIKRMGLGAPPKDGPDAAAPRAGDDNVSRSTDVAAVGEPAATASAAVPQTSAAGRRSQGHGETTTMRSQEHRHRREDRDVQGPSTATTNRGKCWGATPSPTTQDQQHKHFPGPRRQRLPAQHCPSSSGVASLAGRLPSRDVHSTVPIRGPRSRGQRPARIMSKLE